MRSTLVVAVLLACTSCGRDERAAPVVKTAPPVETAPTSEEKDRTPPPQEISPRLLAQAMSLAPMIECLKLIETDPKRRAEEISTLHAQYGLPADQYANARPALDLDPGFQEALKAGYLSCRRSRDEVLDLLVAIACLPAASGPDDMEKRQEALIKLVRKHGFTRATYKYVARKYRGDPQFDKTLSERTAHCGNEGEIDQVLVIKALAIAKRIACLRRIEPVASKRAKEIAAIHARFKLPADQYANALAKFSVDSSFRDALKKDQAAACQPKQE